MDSSVRMTEYSHGAGCGCKISPAVLDVILGTATAEIDDPRLLVGNGSRDDAAVYDLGDGSAIISTTDFFMPIVDDPFTFGRIAATNAISDVYAMGGTPLMAIAIFGWPLDKLSPEVGQAVINGGRKACLDAGIALAGGHSIDAPEPVFGLAVTGRVKIRYLKKNNTAQAGDRLYLSKPLGIGVLSTAQKQKKVTPEHARLAVDTMCELNVLGSTLGELTMVNALTDVTGFGLGGHLREMCEGSGLQAVIEFDKLPLLPPVNHYLDLGCIPGGTLRNFESYGYAFADLTERQKHLLCDPQTSGGLLIAVSQEAVMDFETMMRDSGLKLEALGYLREAMDAKPLIEVV